MLKVNTDLPWIPQKSMWLASICIKMQATPGPEIRFSDASRKTTLCTVSSKGIYHWSL